MLLGSVKEALSYGANTFMFYTGAPQNTRRKAISELKVEEAKALMKENNIDLTAKRRTAQSPPASWRTAAASAGRKAALRKNAP